VVGVGGRRRHAPAATCRRLVAVVLASRVATRRTAAEAWSRGVAWSGVVRLDLKCLMGRWIGLGCKWEIRGY
jgi:hypothetical protein